MVNNDANGEYIRKKVYSKTTELKAHSPEIFVGIFTNMGEGNNLFNTFSFNVWKANNAEEQMLVQNKKRRKKQVRKLKAALKNEKLGKPGGGGGMSAEELAALLAILAAEDSGGENGGWTGMTVESLVPQIEDTNPWTRLL